MSKEENILQAAGEEKLKLEAERKDLEASREKLTALKKNISSLESAKNNYLTAVRAHEEKAKLSASADATFKKANKAYLDAQAGILADTLVSGAPCPVCGSTTHPVIATKPDNAPTKDELDELQEKAAKANDASAKASEAAGKLNGALDEKEKSVNEEIKCLLGEISVGDAPTSIEDKLTSIMSEIDGIDLKIADEQKKIDRKTEINELLPQKKDEAEKAKEKASDLRRELAAKDAENKTLEERISELKEKLSFESKAKAEEEISVLAERIKKLREAIDSAQQELAECDKELASLASAKKEIRKRLDDTVEIDLEQEAARQDDIDSQLKQIEKEEKTVHSRVTANRKSLENIKMKSGDLIAAERKYSWVKALSNTANGNISGKEKIMLETYIQMNYFDRIIARANSRLMIMTDGQYDLVRRKEALTKQGQSGLDLDVIDHYNGSHRSVKSLSGGESFKASLALALGLADEIQSSAGGIKLDTMFVDEGFGSLDEESLSQAMKALTSLADNNRLVGIISHVGELKQKIDKQIVVTKDKSGGSKAEIIIM